jgi:hypothetical protein
LKRLISGLMLATSVACSLPNEGRRTECALLRVEVTGFDDVRLYNHAGTPIGTFMSMRPRNVKLCGAVYMNQYPAFTIDAIGGRYVRRVWPSGLPTLAPGMAIRLQIGEHRDILTMIRTAS